MPPRPVLSVVDIKHEMLDRRSKESWTMEMLFSSEQEHVAAS
jgi:hypothetical protein